MQLKHDELELRRVPLCAPFPGFAAPPAVGDLVAVHFADGDLHQPLAAGRFYHDEDRPPLHREGEILLEQRVPDGTLNHLRFTDDGSIVIQRDVSKPEDNSEAVTSIRVDGSSGDLEIKVGSDLTVTLTLEEKIRIEATGKPIEVACKELTVDGDVSVNGDLAVNSASGSTTISGNEITGS